MKESANQFFREAGKIAWTSIRYIFVSILISLAGLSVVTGKFPPPVKDIYRNITSLRSSLDMTKASSQIAKAKIDRETTLTQLDEDNSRGGRWPNDDGEAPAQTADPRRKIKALEYEVALLKSKLNRAEAETSHLKAQQGVVSKK